MSYGKRYCLSEITPHVHHIDSEILNANRSVCKSLLSRLVSHRAIDRPAPEDRETVIAEMVILIDQR